MVNNAQWTALVFSAGVICGITLAIICGVHHG